MNRRSILQAGGLALTGSLAGCSLVNSQEPSRVTISEIEIRNRLEDEIDVSVLLLNDGTAEYWQTVTVPTAPNPFTTLADLPDSSGEYVLYAQIPATDRDSPVRANLVEDAGDQSCITVYMEITMADSDSEEYPSVVYGAIGDCQNTS